MAKNCMDEKHLLKKNVVRQYCCLRKEFKFKFKFKFKYVYWKNPKGITGSHRNTYVMPAYCTYKSAKNFTIWRKVKMTEPLLEFSNGLGGNDTFRHGIPNINDAVTKT